MKKEQKKYIIQETDSLYKMKKNDIDNFSECSALAYQNYPLFDYILKGKIKHKIVKTIMSASIHSMGKKAIGFANDKSADAVAIFTPPNYTGSKVVPFLLGGGIKLMFIAPPSTFVRLLKYENHAMKLKKHYTSHDCWYLYNITVKPESQSKGYCSQLLKPMFEYFDRIGQDCYLETHLKNNVDLYKHFGFELIDTSYLPKSNIKQYSMLRKSQGR